MRMIGLCGRSGSGKTGFCKLAKELGYKVVDCDEVYAELVSKRTPCLEEIVEHFGDIAIKDGALNRKAVAQIVFSDKEKLLLLNKITHKHISKRVFEIIAEYGENEIVILGAPALFESGLDSACESVIGITAPDQACIARIIARDGITEEQARSRLSNQRTNDFIIENSDYIIINDSSHEAFCEASQSLLLSIKEEKA